MKKHLLKKVTAGILSFAMVACVGFAATNITAKAAEDEITANMPQFVEGQLQDFSVAFNPSVENAYTVRVAVTLYDKNTGEEINFAAPESKDIVEVFYKEGNEWKPFVYDSFGPESGFPYVKATSEFRAEFNQVGDYVLSLTVYQVNGGDVATWSHDFTVSHAVQHVEAVAPTADKAGNIEYWYDWHCEKYYKDAALTEEISYNDTILPATGDVTDPDNPGDKPGTDNPSDNPSGDKGDGESADKTTDKPDSPKTADPMTLGLLIAAMGASGAGIAGLKKRK